MTIQECVEGFMQQFPELQAVVLVGDGIQVAYTEGHEWLSRVAQTVVDDLVALGGDVVTLKLKSGDNLQIDRLRQDTYFFSLLRGVTKFSTFPSMHRRELEKLEKLLP